MTPNDWTGDVCELVEGEIYVARAVWQWKSKTGMLNSVARRLEFTYRAGASAVETESKQR